MHVDDTTVARDRRRDRLRFCGDATTTPAEAGKLAEALVELADWADGTR